MGGAEAGMALTPRKAPDVVGIGGCSVNKAAKGRGQPKLPSL